MEKKSLDYYSPDETITFEKGKVEIAKVGDTSIGKGYFEPELVLNATRGDTT